MSYRDRQRLSDIQAAIDAIRSHLQRGTLDDGLAFDAVRIRLLKIGEAVKDLPDRASRHSAGDPVASDHLRDHLAHRYFDTAHSNLRATVAEENFGFSGTWNWNNDYESV